MMKRIILGLLLCALCAGKASAGDTAKLPAEKTDPVIAEIGEKVIYFSEVEKAAQGLNRFLKENFDTNKTWRINFTRQYIAQVSLAIRAKNEGLEQDADVVEKIKRSAQGILADALLSKELSTLTISEDNVKAYYEQNKKKYEIPEQIKICYLKLSDKKTADKFIAKLNKGIPFDKVAGRKKIKVNNWMTRGAMMSPELTGVKPEEMDKVFSLGIGGSSQPIEGTEGVFIFHVDAKQPAKDRPFEDLKQQIRFEVTRQIREKAVNDYILETFTMENVKIYEDRVASSITASNAQEQGNPFKSVIKQEKNREKQLR